jgi:hypothetical protein
MQSQGNALLVDAGGCAVEVACAEPSHKAKRSCLGIRRIIMKRLSVIFASLLVSLCSLGAWARPDHEPPKRHAERDTSAIAENFRIGVDRTITVEPGATRWVNVRRAEVIRFVVKPAGGSPDEFIRRMDVLSNQPYPLSKLAPEGLASGLANVMVYVAPDRLSRR